MDCDPTTGNLDLVDAERKLQRLRGADLDIPADTVVVGIIPVHVGGLMMDIEAVQRFAAKHALWIVKDAHMLFRLPAEGFREQMAAMRGADLRA